MNIGRWFELFRKWVALLAVAVGMFGFYGFIAAVVFKFALNVPDPYGLFCGTPFGFGVVWFMWPRLPEILGFEGSLYK